ncbi:hypothetical protein GGI42DRAFT_318921 [Trichoderma sp. SZMC 28013]
MNVVILLVPFVLDAVHPKLSFTFMFKLYSAYMVALRYGIHLKYRRHMAFTAPCSRAKKQGNATLFPLTRQSRICKRGQCRAKAKTKLFNETCVEARVCICVPCATKPLCVNDTA